MALLIDVGHGGWMTPDEIRQAVQAHAPEADIRVRADLGDPAEITMLAVSTLPDDLPGLLPNLQLVQKLGAGVETIVSHPALSDHVRVARLRPDAPAREIAEYCLAYILRSQRNMALHERNQAASRWESVEPRYTPDTVVGVLGLGHIGGRTAKLLRDIGFQVRGWSRSPHQIDGVTCQFGADALPDLLSGCDYICAILPSTPSTRAMLDAKMLAHVKSGCVLINAGRGDLIDEAALVRALDTGPLGGAVLDVLSREPLPAQSPLWSHPKVTITPHVSGWHLGDAFADVAQNLRRLTKGMPLLHEVDRAQGY